MAFSNALLRQARTSALLALSGASSIALGWCWSIALVNIGTALLVVGCAASWSENWRHLRQQTFVWLSLLTVGYLLLMSALTAGDYSGPDIDIAKALARYAALAGLPGILMACALRGNFRRMAWIYAIALGTFVVTILAHYGREGVASFIGGERAFLGLSGNGPSVYALTSILALLTLGPRLLQGLRARWRVPAILGIVLMLVVLSSAVVFNQSRSALLAGGIVLPFTLAFLAWSHFRPRDRKAVARSWSNSAVALAVVVVLGVAFLLGSELLVQRFHADRDAISNLLELRFNEIPSESIADRVAMWRSAFRLFLERPVLGWGPGSARPLIAQMPEGLSYPHFHNLYLHVLVELGIVGLLLYGGVLLFLAAALRDGVRKGYVPPELALFLSSAGALFLIVSLAQIRHDDWHGAAYLTLLVALGSTRSIFPPTA